jgi:hypothetical protein
LSIPAPCPSIAQESAALDLLNDADLGARDPLYLSMPDDELSEYLCQQAERLAARLAAVVATFLTTDLPTVRAWRDGRS